MSYLINQYNRYDRPHSLIQKALTSATGVGEGLIPENLEQQITNTIIRLSPELALMATKKIAGKQHDFNRLVKLPRAGGAMGEAASTITSNSQTVRANVELKVIRRRGEITNFLQDTSEDYINAAAYETENLIQQHIYDLINYILYGNASANQYEFSGLDYFVSTNRSNEVLNGATITLAKLDAMIDASTVAGGNKHNRTFVMSPFMLSRISALLTNVRLNQGLTAGGLTQVDLAGGWRLNAYRDIPIVESTSVRPDTIDYGTVGSSTATTGGTITAGTYYFNVAAVTDKGEQLASTEISQTTTGTTSTITLTWTDVEDAYRYKIYAGNSTGTAKTLKRVISADTYDAVGTIIGRTASYTFVSDPLTKDATVPDAQQNDIQLEQTGDFPPEYVFLWDLDPIQGLGKLPYTNTGGARFNGLITIEQLARTDDNIPLLIKSYAALPDAFERTSFVARGLKAG